MPKFLTVSLSDIEYSILVKDLKKINGEGGEKLRNLLRLYISSLPELKSSEYALRRNENKRYLEEILHSVWDAYENTDYPDENWDEDKLSRLINDLVEINILSKVGDGQVIPAYKFRSLFKMLLHDIATENRDMDEFSAACVATIQLLKEFGNGVLSKEAIRDGTILINEGWMFHYAAAMKRAREFLRTNVGMRGCHLHGITTGPEPASHHIVLP